MVRQVIDVDGYWKVIVYWDVDYDLFSVIERELRWMGITKQMLRELRDTMESGKAKAVTYSNLEKRVSIVLFNRHESIEDYINSMVHEAEHVKQAMLRGYYVEDEGEDPAYTIGYLVMRMWEVFREKVACFY